MELNVLIPHFPALKPATCFDVRLKFWRTMSRIQKVQCSQTQRRDAYYLFGQRRSRKLSGVRWFFSYWA